MYVNTLVTQGDQTRGLLLGPLKVEDKESERLCNPFNKSRIQ